MERGREGGGGFLSLVIPFFFGRTFFRFRVRWRGGGKEEEVKWSM